MATQAGLALKPCANMNLSASLNVEIFPQVSLSEYTTFQLGGPCRGIIFCQTPLELERVIHFFARKNLPFILIGGGSNLVICDEGIDCYVVRYLSETPLIERDGHDLVVSGSTLFDQLALFAAENSLEGFNYATGIPGTVGGAIVGNAGAFGQQVADALESVVLLNKNGQKKEVDAEALQFQYRDSILKGTGDIVVSAKFILRAGDREALLKERETIIQLRREKHPDLKIYPCAGSFFRNIEPTSLAEKRQAAGWFLEQVGGKKLFHGGAVIFEKHANIIVKSHGCRSQDIFELSKKMQKLVKEHFNLDLVREVRFVGKFAGMPENVKEFVW